MRDLPAVAREAPMPAAQIAAVKMGCHHIATKALPEPKREPPTLFITRCFGDALRIGDQNCPRSLHRHIMPSAMLYPAAHEIGERIHEHSEVLTPLDLAQSQCVVEAAYAQGLRACASMLMHGCRYPQQEQQLAALARNTEFTRGFRV